MQSTDESRLVEIISQSFAEPAHPPEGPLFHDPDSYWTETEGELLGRRWQEVHVPTFIYTFDSIEAMKPATLQYYLPAYLLAVVLHYRDADLLPCVIVHALTPPSPGAAEEVRNRFDGFVGGLTPDQRSCVRAFLGFLQETHGEDWDEGEVDESESPHTELEQAQEFWAQY